MYILKEKMRVYIWYMYYNVNVRMCICIYIFKSIVNISTMIMESL